MALHATQYNYHGLKQADVRKIWVKLFKVCEVGQSHDLIVVSSHGRKELNRFMLGSVSDGIVHRASCSVLLVR